MTVQHVKNEVAWYKPLRNKAKYKKLARLNFNITQTLKIFKLNKQKWYTFHRYLNKIFKRRIFCQSFFRLRRRNNNSFFFRKYVINKRKFHPKQLYLKRRFHYWYGLTKYKYMKNAYLKKFLLSYNYFYTKVKDILSLFYQYEHRLDVILYRVHFFPTITSSREFVCRSFMVLNRRKWISYPNHILEQNDMIEIFAYRIFVYKNLKKLLNDDFYSKEDIKKDDDDEYEEMEEINYFRLINYPHLEVNYNMMAIILIKPIINLKELKTFFNFQIDYSILQLYLIHH